MRTLVWILILSLLGLGAAFAQPKIGSVVNTASYQVPPNDSKGNPIGNHVIAQGSIFAIFGTGLGPTTIAYPAGLPLPTAVPAANGTSVSVSGGGTTVSAYIVYTSAGQVGAILPSNTPVGAAEVTVTYNGKTSGTYAISVVPSRLGIFTSNSQGYGVVAAQHGANSAPVLLSQAAQPGETVVLYGTGLGPLPSGAADNVAPGSVQIGTNVTVTIAGQTVTPQYAGRSPSFAGLDQINFTIPASITANEEQLDAGTCYTPVSITASGQTSQDVVIPIAKNGSACEHVFGLSETALASLDSGSPVNVGLFQILRAFVTSLGGPVEGAGGLFNNADANSVFNMYQLIPVAYGAVTYPAPLNACTVIDQIDTSGGFSLPPFSQIGGTELVADAVALDISGPATLCSGSPNCTDNIDRQPTGGYVSAFIPAILSPGSWTISGKGGVDVGAFSASLTLPADLTWTNAGNFSSIPQASLTITWSGGTGAGTGIVTVFGTSTIVNPTDPTQTRGKSFYCAAKASDEQFVVPQNVRAQMPSAASGETSFGTLGITTGGFGTFTAPLKKGTLDAGVIDYGEAYVLSVTY